MSKTQDDNPLTKKTVDQLQGIRSQVSQFVINIETDYKFISDSNKMYERIQTAKREKPDVYKENIKVIKEQLVGIADVVKNCSTHYKAALKKIDKAMSESTKLLGSFKNDISRIEKDRPKEDSKENERNNNKIGLKH